MEQVKVRPGLPILIPYEPTQFWEQVRKIIREEIKEFENGPAFTDVRGVPGLKHKPLYKVSDLCAFFTLPSQQFMTGAKTEK